MLKFTRMACLALIIAVGAIQANGQTSYVGKAKEGAMFVTEQSDSNPFGNFSPKVASDEACNPPRNLYVTEGTGGVLCAWDDAFAPVEASTDPEYYGRWSWLENGYRTYMTVAYTQQITWTIAVRYSTWDLQNIPDGCTLEKLVVYAHNESNIDVEYKIYSGGSYEEGPSELLLTQTVRPKYDPTGNNGAGSPWFVFELDEPITIDKNKELWITAKHVMPANQFCLSYQLCEATPTKSNIVYIEPTDGSSPYWGEYDDINWTIQAYVATPAGSKAMLKHVKGEPIRSTSISKYNIYVEDKMIGSTQDTSYTIIASEAGIDIPSGVSTPYGVSAVFSDDCESEIIYRVFAQPHCDFVTNATAAKADEGINLSWAKAAAPKIDSLPRLSTENVWMAVALTPAVNGHWATHRFVTGEIRKFHNWVVQKVLFQPTDKAGFYNPYIFQGGDVESGKPGTEIFRLDQPIEGKYFKLGQWNEVYVYDPENPVVINDALELWVGIHGVTADKQGAAAINVDRGPSADRDRGNITMFDDDGSGNYEYIHLTALTNPINANWMIKVVVMNPATGKTMVLGENDRAADMYDIYVDSDDAPVVENVSAMEYLDTKTDKTVKHDYYIVAKYANGCVSSKEAGYVLYDPDVAINNNTLENVKIYPNPATDMVTVNGENITKVEVYNTVGQLIVSKTSNVSKVDVSSFDNGIYLFRVYSGEKVTTQRVIVGR